MYSPITLARLVDHYVLFPHVLFQKGNNEQLRAEHLQARRQLALYGYWRLLRLLPQAISFAHASSRLALGRLGNYRLVERNGPGAILRT